MTVDNFNLKWINIEDILPPQDGSPFLGYDPKKEDEGKIYVLIFIKGKRYFGKEFEKLSYNDHYIEASGERYFHWNPTHWMPLPPFPI